MSSTTWLPYAAGCGLLTSTVRNERLDAVKLSDLAGRPLTYAEVGATAAALPAGYHHVRLSSRIGSGRARFESAAGAVMRYGMLRGAGLRVAATTEVAEVGTDVLGRLGPFAAPCRVAYVVD